ncbi:MAG TPA: hypothetical protein PLI90_04785 [Rhodocyclaceae bacterium]|nr:hypothetical protein [Rhodocyclaceae bacterium]
MKRKTAIVFLTHQYSESILQAFAKLRDEGENYGDVFLLGDGSQKPPPDLQDQICLFDFSELKAQFPLAIGDRVVPGNLHLVYWEFFRTHKEYEYIWFVEYDVRYAGSWADFLEHFSENTADLIGCHIRRWEHEPQWFWWDSLSRQGAPVPEAERIRAFLPVLRLSRTACRTIHTALESGWTGHSETFIPTSLSMAGLVLEDMGGDGPFVSPGNHHRFYSSENSQDGRLTSGSMRFRPVHSLWGQQRDWLYHPVKEAVSMRTDFG